MSDLRVEFIRKLLGDFENSVRCCQLLSASFLDIDLPAIKDEAANLSLKLTTTVQNDGISLIKVFKTHCSHTHTSLSLQQHKERAMPAQWQPLSANCLLGSATSRPEVPPHRFSIGPLKQTMLRPDFEFPPSLLELSYRSAFVAAVQRCRVLLVNGSAACEKSTMLPLCLMQDLAARRSQCKIICVERERLLAGHYSQRVAERLNERIGNAVAYQVPLQSRISETSNLIYTTAAFLLRVLMGQRTIDSFRHISHVFVADVHRGEAFGDLLLCELRDAFQLYPALRVILLSDDGARNAALLEYFGEGENFEIDEPNAPSPRLVYLREWRAMLGQKSGGEAAATMFAVPPPSTHPKVTQLNADYLDRCLERYEDSGGLREAFEAFVYMVRGEYASVNHRHTVTGRTAAVIAARLGNAVQLRTLLDELHADPFIRDAHDSDVIFSAVVGGSRECRELRGSFFSEEEEATPKQLADYDARLLPAHRQLIVDLIQALFTSASWTPGNIAVFLPNYEEIVLVNFALLRQKLLGQLPAQLAINVLHADIDQEQLDTLLAVSGSANAGGVTITLCTDVGESLCQALAIRYVIDSARLQRTVYDAQAQCNAEQCAWLDQQSALRRCQLINQPDGVCFRLMPLAIWPHLPATPMPELPMLPLERVCLTVKLIAPQSLVGEYLQNTITQPPLLHVHAAVEQLKCLQILDELEEVTWLGCRLIDVPVDCHLGRLLVHGILLQCLDPVLTIVSALANCDPLALPTDDAVATGARDAAHIRNELQLERRRLLTAPVPSDHLVYVRLYQAWQSEQHKERGAADMLIDEHHFRLNCLMDRMCDARTQLVGALRSAQLIHNQGQLSMYHLNLKANSWPLVKAALVGGSGAPYLCLLDGQTGRIQSSRRRELMLHPSSVLRELRLQPSTIYARQLKTPWLVYARQTDSACANSIGCCTAVTPLAVALFGGTVRADCSEVHIDQIAAPPAANAGTTTTPDSAQSPSIMLHLDESLTLPVHLADAELLRMRQTFYACYHAYLQNCGSVEYCRRNSEQFAPLEVCDKLEKLLQQEDQLYDLKAAEHVGLRPKAIPTTFLRSCNERLAGAQIAADVSVGHFVPPLQQYFLSYQTDPGLFYAAGAAMRQQPVLQFIRPHLGDHKHKLTYVILYNKIQFHSVARVAADGQQLQECFRNRVRIYELLDICRKQGICLPTFNERRVAFKVDKQFGRIILHLFAYRNRFLHYN